jgi:penicillin-binding protein 1C
LLAASSHCSAFFMKRFRVLYLIILLSGTFIFLWKLLPDPLFQNPFSTVLLDRNGELLGARVADDDQWRFPQPDSVPEKFCQSLICYEDRHFYQHPGVNPFSLLRAVRQNITERKIISGGSTISMQLIRLSRKPGPRTIGTKLLEIILALRLELGYSKKEILKLYAAHAPFGGNVVGLEAASWRYFGRDPFTLSWAESAMLAALPNSPALIHPGKNRELLLKKRNFVLRRLYEEKILDSLNFHLARMEELPEKPYPLPDLAPHLLDLLLKQRNGERIQTSIDISLQEKVNRIMAVHSRELYANEIHGAACIVQEVSTGEVLVYYGNIKNIRHPEYGGDVDIILSRRSTGSIFKPLLFAEMLYRGDLLPLTLIPDIPTYYRGFSPKNYNRGYDGAVPAKSALERSLNIPAVRMLNKYGVERFYKDLKDFGINQLNYPSSHYGLSLILGGSESNLWEICGLYSNLARILIHYNFSGGKYFRDDIHPPLLVLKDKVQFPKEGLEQGLLGAGSIWLMFESLLDVNRPYQESGWEFFASSRKIAWKTGTSFGFRDAWAVGTTPAYTIGIWTGNPSGEGRPGLTGVITSAPILFEVFNLLPASGWFDTPYDDLYKVEICRRSGHIAGPLCNETDSVYISSAGRQTPACPYHRLIHLDEKEIYRVNSDCYSPDRMIHRSWFILPPAQEWYFRQKNLWYKSVPSMLDGCKTEDDIPQMQLIYPEPGTKVYVPYELDGTRGRLICQAIHRNAAETVFWHIDDQYIGSTKDIHQMAILPAEGPHKLILTDNKGNRVIVSFSAVEKD